jgi:hypothetical protein
MRSPADRSTSTFVFTSSVMPLPTAWFALNTFEPPTCLISQVSHRYVPLILNFTSLFIFMQLYRYSFGYQRNSSLILISPPVPQKKSVLAKSSTPPASIPLQTKRVSTPIQSLHVSTPPLHPHYPARMFLPDHYQLLLLGLIMVVVRKGSRFFASVKQTSSTSYPKFMPIGKLPSAR